ncbi:caspase family protein [Hyunsoonleella pacifica]|uniref:Caspase family protein n=1 Tax=Hyunsoonleella pacifica TaxID=1080224 RepID=A0A4Q9FRW0_9FLAO|nr:caspase family protein [Hyunsoonleella pacifica]TBN18838.1 caspase family protein [Hyunsoonleella pacifica]GGD05217.1 hypothetical protein GCM10011368_03760 [Hyunsoonleella pacifica]
MISKKALVVGVNYYDKFNGLSGCVKDANAVASALEHNDDDKSLNFSINRIIATNSGSILRKKALEDSVKALFEDDVDVALFYFSGHGFIKPSGGYLVTSECKVGDEGLSLSELLYYANESPADNKIIILDCCHSGKLGLDIHANDIAKLSEGLTILCSSAEDEVSVEKYGRGVFTSLLVDALEGSAADILGNIFLENLYANISPALSIWEQTPVCRISINGLTLIKKTKPAITIADLRKIAELFNDTDDEHQLDPSYEPESNMPNLVNTKKFGVLQKYNRLNLVVPIEAPHMYHAAIWSKSCVLTPLGRYYWKLVSNKKI